MNKHYEKAKQLYRIANRDILECGHEAMLAVDTEGMTLRQMSVDLCGNETLEDRLSRWVMAARWADALRSHPLYADALQWLTPTHFTEYWKIATREDTETALAVMEQTFIRAGTDKIVAAHSVQWLRGKQPAGYSVDELYHRVWSWAARALPEAYSELERAGQLATERDYRRVELLKQVIAEFSAEPEGERA